MLNDTWLGEAGHSADLAIAALTDIHEVSPGSEARVCRGRLITRNRVQYNGTYWLEPSDSHIQVQYKLTAG